MYDITTPSLTTGPWEDALVLQELDRLVALAWEPGWAPMALGELVRLCRQLRERHDGADWPLMRQILRGHDIYRLLREDPLVFFAGRPQAEVQDLLAGHPAAAPLLAETSRAGRDLFAASRGLPWLRALAGRPGFLARMAETVAIDRPGAEILTLGAGHLREAQLLAPEIRPRRWVVLEQDAVARGALLQQAPAGMPVRTMRCSLRGFARRPEGRGCFDLICLPDLPAEWGREAQADLLQAAFSLLRPGGYLALCAPGPAPAEAAWMDAFLGWNPAWRSERELEDLLAGIPARQTAWRRIYPALDGPMLHAVLRRAG